MLWSLTTLALAAEPYMAFEWRPLGRADLTWVLEDRTTGLAVGGLDGFARPQGQLSAGAWVHEIIALQGSLGVARLQRTSWVGDVYTQQHWGVIRPGIDARLRLFRPPDGLPRAWAIGGVSLDIPSARDVSNGYTAEEQVTADEVATADRARLGAFGARYGFGVDQTLVGGLSIGAMYTVQWQRSLFVSDDPVTISSLLTGEAALLLQFAWPARDADTAGDEVEEDEVEEGDVEEEDDDDEVTSNG